MIISRIGVCNSFVRYILKNIKYQSVDKHIERSMVLTATGSLGSINSTEATPSGDWISPDTVGWKQWKKSRNENKRKSIGIECGKVNQ